MKPGDAVKLTNIFPTTSDVQLRKGSAVFTTGAAAQVETLASYKPTSGSSTLWAFAGASIFNSTTPGALPAASVTGLSNARWQTTNCTTAGGSFLLCVNGVDKMELYDGSTWTAIDTLSTPAITGVATTLLMNVNIFKGRVFYIEKNSFRVWYSAPGAFAGALTLLDLSPIFKKGGSLVAMGSWSLDGGDGSDDLAVFVSTEGEVAVYQGIDPSSATSWAIVGMYSIGAPIGTRCIQKYKGDLVFITLEGLVPASKALIDEESTHAIALSDRIGGAVTDAAALYNTNFGWEVTQFPLGNMLVMNVPISGTAMQQQYVMNTTTGAWCNFTGWAANCFVVHNKNLYFGTNGGVNQGWTGTSDLGAIVTGELIGAFDYFRNRDGLKEMTLIRPVIGWDSNPATFFLGVDVDFVSNSPTNQIALSGTTGAVWDTDLWDVGVWGGDVVLNKTWYFAAGIGYAIAPHLIISSLSARVRIASFDFAYKQGGIL